MTNLSLWKVSELEKITGGKLISNINIIEQDIFITGVSTDPGIFLRVTCLLL